MATILSFSIHRVRGLLTSRRPAGRGGVGIGTSSPNGTLDVRGNIYFGPTSSGSATLQQALTSDGSGASMRLLSPAGVFLYAGPVPSKLEVTSNATCEAGTMYCFTDAGSFGMGTLTPQTAVDLGTALGTIKVAVYESSGAGFYGIGVNSNLLTFGAGIAANGTPQMVLQSSGYVGIGTTTPSYPLYVNGTAYAAGAAGALSDIRHKDKIQPFAPGALQLVERLKPVTFVWKDPKDDGMRGEQIGFIAQDVQKTLPDVVLVEKNAEKTMGIKYTEIIPVLTAAIQEQQAEIAELRAEVAALKAR